MEEERLRIGKKRKEKEQTLNGFQTNAVNAKESIFVFSF